METLTIDRRAPAAASAVPGASDPRTIVQQGIGIQTRLGTIGAVEYLKAHDIGGAVIHRVLASEEIRNEDREMREASPPQA